MPAKQQTTLAAALAAAQSKMDNVLKNKKNPHFKSDYADLSAVRDVVIPALNEQGIACVQHIDGDCGFCTVRTVLHFGAESMEVGNKTVSVSGSRSECQSALSAATYLRRGHLAALGGIAQADDDGESTVRQQRTETRPQRQRTPPPAPQGPKAKPGAVPCPKCQSKTWDNFAYREWMKSNPHAKKKAALACDDWKNCKWTIWDRTSATAFLSDAAIASKPKTATDEKPALFEDGLNKT